MARVRDFVVDLDPRNLLFFWLLHMISLHKSLKQGGHYGVRGGSRVENPFRSQGFWEGRTCFVIQEGSGSHVVV